MSNDERCPRCDREDCRVEAIRAKVEATKNHERRRARGMLEHAVAECEAHRADWRARFTAATERAERAEAEAARVRAIVEDVAEKARIVEPDEDADGTSCSKCGGSYDLDGREPADHGECWPCSTETLSEIGAIVRGDVLAAIDGKEQDRG